VSHKNKSAQEIEHQLRTSSPPIITRISDGKVLLDLRTVFLEEIPALREALTHLEK
jgi:seryl-tRNA(Sec) selenium transferase